MAKKNHVCAVFSRLTSDKPLGRGGGATTGCRALGRESCRFFRWTLLRRVTLVDERHNAGARDAVDGSRAGALSWSPQADAPSDRRCDPTRVPNHLVPFREVQKGKRTLPAHGPYRESLPPSPFRCAGSRHIERRQTFGTNAESSSTLTSSTSSHPRTRFEERPP
ncbi:hypothetical protein LZ32DRAFT_14049 [Colletotrichum eremochloae]|nr:hypothetical protein LZ32DRAFT_14049 [Colletotrichum eremochloae]